MKASVKIVSIMSGSLLVVVGARVLRPDRRAEGSEEYEDDQSITREFDQYKKDTRVRFFTYFVGFPLMSILLFVASFSMVAIVDTFRIKDADSLNLLKEFKFTLFNNAADSSYLSVSLALLALSATINIALSANIGGRFKDRPNTKRDEVNISDRVSAAVWSEGLGLAVKVSGIISALITVSALLSPYDERPLIFPIVIAFLYLLSIWLDAVIVEHVDSEIFRARGRHFVSESRGKLQRFRNSLPQVGKISKVKLWTGVAVDILLVSAVQLVPLILTLSLAALFNHGWRLSILEQCGSISAHTWVSAGLMILFVNCYAMGSAVLYWESYNSRRWITPIVLIVLGISFLVMSFLSTLVMDMGLWWRILTTILTTCTLFGGIFLSYVIFWTSKRGWRHIGGFKGKWALVQSSLWREGERLENRYIELGGTNG